MDNDKELNTEKNITLMLLNINTGNNSLLDFAVMVVSVFVHDRETTPCRFADGIFFPTETGNLLRLEKDAFFMETMPGFSSTDFSEELVLTASET